MPREPTLAEVMEAVRRNTAALEQHTTEVQALTQAIFNLARESATHTEMLQHLLTDVAEVRDAMTAAAKPSGETPLHEVLQALVRAVSEGNGLLRQVLAAVQRPGNGHAGK